MTVTATPAAMARLDGTSFDPLRKRAGLNRARPPKEQPPWNLSGNRDRKGDDSLESEGVRVFHRRGRQARSFLKRGVREISQVPMTDRGVLKDPCATRAAFERARTINPVLDGTWTPWPIRPHMIKNALRSTP